MATTDVVPDPSQDRQAQRRRPFATWVKKLTNFKSSSDGERHRRNRKAKRHPKLNNPYPESGYVGNDDSNVESGRSFTTALSGSNTSLDRSRRDSADGAAPPTAGARSMAGTVSTDHEGTHSLMAPSHGASSLAGTSRTVGGGLDSRRGGDSTFSSPAPSVRSLTTTLTTIQSVAPHGNLGSTPAQNNTQSIQFSQPFPTTSPASAIPPHLAPTGNPTTYTSATAHNLLTDNASILTLASSSKRRRRRSMDTDASVRALAPSSLWGGSRESLPLSVLSSNIESGGVAGASSMHGGGMRAGAERTSIYSTTGVAPAIASERNSVYAGKGDGASVRSGLLGHGRADSVSGGNVTVMNQLASPQEVPDDKSEKRSNGPTTAPAGKEE
ncbi:hypothetical protein HJFPF1_00366 [Paramyrothecium foliicola]|nr:hypothetical protein HJFPF1_00366 [Paramyrothecium foliicola]